MVNWNPAGMCQMRKLRPSRKRERIWAEKSPVAFRPKLVDGVAEKLRGIHLLVEEICDAPELSHP